MSSHADTSGHGITDGFVERVAYEAMRDKRDALLAENQRLQADLDWTTTAGNRIEQQLVEAASVMTKLRAEKQRLREALEQIAALPSHNVFIPDIAREALAGDAE